MRSTARISRKTSEMVCQCERGTASTGVPCTRKRSIDQVDGSLERGVYIEIRGIEQVRVGRPAQGRRGAVLVPFVAAADIAQHFGFTYAQFRPVSAQDSAAWRAPQGSLSQIVSRRHLGRSPCRCPVRRAPLLTWRGRSSADRRAALPAPPDAWPRAKPLRRGQVFGGLGRRAWMDQGPWRCRAPRRRRPDRRLRAKVSRATAR